MGNGMSTAAWMSCSLLIFSGQSEAALKLPDLLEAVEELLHGHSELHWVGAPRLLPTVPEIEALSGDEQRDRRDFWLSACALTVAGTVLVGALVLRSKTEQRAGQRSSAIAGRSFFGHYTVCIAVVAWSAATDRLSLKVGLDWEMYYVLMAMSCSWLLVQAFLRKQRLGTGAFVEAAVSAMVPFFSDAVDTLKDAMFGGVCLLSSHPLLKVMGVCSWAYLLWIHVQIFRADPAASAEFENAYAGVLLAAPGASEAAAVDEQPFARADSYEQLTQEVDGGTPQASTQTCPARLGNAIASGCLSLRDCALRCPVKLGTAIASACGSLRDKALPVLVKQTCPAKLRMVIKEDAVQAAFAFVYAGTEGGAPVVIVLNLALPAAKVAFALLFGPCLARLAELWLRQQLSKAITNRLLQKCDYWQETMEAGGPITREAWSEIFSEAAAAGTEGADKIAEALEKDTTVTELNLLGKMFCRAYTSAVAEVLKTNTSVTKLQLEGNSIGEFGARALAEALKTNASLTSLDLRRNSIGAPGAIALSEALKTNTSLTTLQLEGNSIGESGARALAEVLKTNTSLTTLQLGNNSIGDSGASALAEALKDNTHLTVLGLGYNAIGESGAKALGEALKENGSLTELRLYGNSIGDSGAKALGEALKTNTSLTTLQLNRNSIGDSGASALGEALKQNTSLTTLYLQANSIGDSGARAVLDALEEDNKTLTELDLRGNSAIDANIQEAIAKAVKRNLDSKASE